MKKFLMCRIFKEILFSNNNKAITEAGCRQYLHHIANIQQQENIRCLHGFCSSSWPENLKDFLKLRQLNAPSIQGKIKVLAAVDHHEFLFSKASVSYKTVKMADS